ncbi:MAG: META domain-containing protein [Colwellia sp.]|nr:META domain-containing protein [Colwellia sp.]
MKNHYSNRNIYFLVLVIASLTSACQMFSERGSQKELHSNNAQVLTTQRWQLVKLHSSDIKLTTLQGIPFISFIASTHKVEGFAGCNNFFGSYSKKNQSLTVSALGMTRRYCADTSTLEFQYENMLAKVTKFQIMKHRLVLLADNKVLATFKAME